MAERSIRQLEKNRESLLNQLQYLTLEHTNLYKQFEQLGQNEPKTLKEDLLDFQSIISQKQRNILHLNQQCNKAATEKKYRNLVIDQFNAKIFKMKQMMVKEKQKVQKMIINNQKIEESIRVIRDEYEKYQEQIYHIDTKRQNIKNYGCQKAPVQIIELFNRKEIFQQDITIFEERIDAKKKLINQMVSKEEAENLKQKIQSLKIKKNAIKVIKQKNQALMKQNQKLSQIKSQYQWNPSIEIKSLESVLQKQETKINQIQKEISCTNKKASDCNHKIDQYKKYLRRGQKREDDQTKKEKIYQDFRSENTSIYEEIKKEIKCESSRDKKKRSKNKNYQQDYNSQKQKARWSINQLKIKEKLLLIPCVLMIIWALIRLWRN